MKKNHNTNLKVLYNNIRNKICKYYKIIKEVALFSSNNNNNKN